jgi:Ca-activated chloride channel family protein
MSNRNLLIIHVALFALVLFIQPSTNAQRRQRSTIQGNVVDANNARVAGALVTVESTHLRRELETNDEGNFQVELPPDDYTISVEKAGFKKFALSRFRTERDSQHNLTVRLKVKAPAMLLKIK